MLLSRLGCCPRLNSTSAIVETLDLQRGRSRRQKSRYQSPAMARLMRPQMSTHPSLRDWSRAWAVFTPPVIDMSRVGASGVSLDGWAGMGGIHGLRIPRLGTPDAPLHRRTIDRDASSADHHLLDPREPNLRGRVGNRVRRPATMPFG